MVDIAVYLYEPSDGGLDRVAIQLANGFAARGFATELWMTRAAGPARALIDPSVPIRIIAAPALRRGLAMIWVGFGLRAAVRRQRPRVLLSAGNQSNLAIALACAGTATAAVAKVTNPIGRPGRGWLAATASRLRFALTVGLARLTLTLSAADAAHHARQFPRARIAPVHNPYVADAMIAASRLRRPRGAVPELLALGRLTLQKDHATLLSALPQLRDRPWRLTVVGDGPLAAALKATVAATGLSDRIVFAGFTLDPLPYLIAADILILPSRWEGMPAVPIEAIACGCAVVATDCAPGLTDLFRTAGLRAPTPVGDADALAVAIAAELDRPSSPADFPAAAAPYASAASIDEHLALFEDLRSPKIQRFG